MQLRLLDAVARIRAELMLSNKSCKNFQASIHMLQNFIAHNIHASAKYLSGNTVENVEGRFGIVPVEQGCQTQIMSGPKFKTEQSRGPRLKKNYLLIGTQTSFALKIEQARLI